jgi:hypothetical protein
MACPTGGAVILNQPGQVLADVDLGGCGIDVQAPNVVIHNVKAHSSWNAGYLLIVRDGYSAAITDSELYGEGLTTTSVEYAIFAPSSAQATIARVNMHHCADCVQGDHVIMTDSYIHDMANIAGTSHPDGFQCNASCSGTVLRHNTVQNYTGNNMGVALFCDFGTPNGAVVDHNLIDMGGSGSYAIWACGVNHRITDNVIGAGYYGWLGIPSGSGSGDVISGNVTLGGQPLT